VNQELPDVVLNDEMTWSELRGRRFDNVVISPGPGRPDRVRDFGVSADAVRECRVPLLGVCLGHQGIGALNGGAVVRGVPVHGKSSRVRHDGGELFARIPSPFSAARYHSLCLMRPLPPCLFETARTDDGVVMALAHRSLPQWGVQFHPESIITEYGRRLAENFRDATRRRTQHPFAIGWSPTASGWSPTKLREHTAYWHAIPRAVDAEAAFSSLYADAPSAFWLDSSLVEDGRTHWSYLGDARGPHAALVQYIAAKRRIEIADAAGYRIEVGDIFAFLDRHCAVALRTPLPCPFAGGHVGWFGYELRGACGAPTSRRALTPDALFIRADRFIAIDHQENCTYVVAIDDVAAAERAQRWIAQTVLALNDPGEPPPVKATRPSLPLRFHPDRDRENYLADIARCLAWIEQGETYQVCLTNEITCALDIDALALYRVMRRTNPAPYAAFLRWPDGAVLSASPERFLQLDVDGRVETKPIKGTIRRDADPLLDRELAERLRSSEKDRAENVMIVDLLRNDLSRVCEPGTVVVPTLYGVESFATVHQLVSTVHGTLRTGATIVDLLRATFPGGSITGAPKTRAVELIDGLEQRPRGVYSGALGWLGDDGAADLSIAIRTIVATDGLLTIGVGGGIVAQSTPAGEFEEMLLKAQGSIRAIVTAATGGFDPGDYVLDGAQVPALTRETV